MKLLILALAGVLTVFISSAVGAPNGVTLIGCLAAAPAITRGILHDGYNYIPRKKRQR